MFASLTASMISEMLAARALTGLVNAAMINANADPNIGEHTVGASAFIFNLRITDRVSRLVKTRALPWLTC